ncbi:hypothetical protein DESA109040_06150 [Deinococcus saxicola]|uniref:hypothetical protein n=1 Tax=Deinococcus saxicola TaxID=249406 RepID=UPI0039F081F7
MTPDDWRKGMENEAASVEDAEWRLDAQREIRRRHQRRAISLIIWATLLYALLGSLLVMGANVAAAGYGSASLRSVLVGMPITPDLTLSPILLLPIIVVSVLAYVGVNQRLLWIAPTAGAALWALASQFLNIMVRLNGTGDTMKRAVDILPPAGGSLSHLITLLMLNVLAGSLGLWLGQALRNQTRRSR